MADDTADRLDRSVNPPDPEVNPPPDELRARVFVVREAAALVFVAVWLLLFAGELVTGGYALPFWYHCVAVGVLGYALGVSVGALVATPPSKGEVARRVVREHREHGASRGEDSGG